ncbi:homeobox protein engrailed-like SMOX-2 [Oppia nitens]|uniref:homeobox protein engrailed-like SMOX-2 n=1 Tax=Oppia nitens TaxID=1686743 RepID=UPI0023DBD198|nr:homeobox protein engrailed-like SMOX-2 [Oppia nitens]
MNNIKYLCTFLCLIFSIVQALPLQSNFTCPADDDCSDSLCMYLNKDDCSTFWHCGADKVAVLKHCLPLLEFNDYFKVCDWPSELTCVEANPKPTTTTTTTTTTTVQPTTEVTDEPITVTTTTTPDPTDDPITTTLSPETTTDSFYWK